MFELTNDWGIILKNEMIKPYFLKLKKELLIEYTEYTIYPPINCIFKAFELTSFSDTRVVILGQDPYHTKNVANGLAFSSDLPKLPGSLKNIYKELKNDLGIEKSDGDLSSWAKQGVLLLNTCLTVRAEEANSHQNIGWNYFTDTVIKKLNEKKDPIIFVLWGSFAQSKSSFITNPVHEVICSAHPSPLSAYRGFFGSKPFSKINKFLEEKYRGDIKW